VPDSDPVRLLSATEPMRGDEKMYVCAAPAGRPLPPARTESLNSGMTAAVPWYPDSPLSSGSDDVVKLSWRGNAARPGRP
jgi:hypothetical protein